MCIPEEMIPHTRSEAELRVYFPRICLCEAGLDTEMLSFLGMITDPV